ncbi:MAG: hypothetical protein HQ568_01530 [Calditrichaeota bacterium]|nr:hypothetical protein [Calditrichota bacterium]
MKVKEFFRLLLTVALLALGLLLLVGIQGKMQAQQAPHLNLGELLWVPDWKIPHILALADDNTAADILWIRSIFYVGEYHDDGDEHDHGHHDEHGAHDKHEHHHMNYTYSREEVSEHGHVHEHQHEHEHDVHHDNHADHHIHEQQDHKIEGDKAPDSIDFKSFDFRNLSIIRKTLAGHLADDEAKHMYHLFNVITELDTMFVTPYYQGAMYLTLMGGRYKEASLLLDKGMKHRPDRWEMPFYRGFIRLFYMNDKAGAINDLRTSSMKKDAPDFVIQLAASIQVGMGQIEMAIEFLKSLYEVTEDQEMKVKIKELIELYSQR